MSNGRFILWPQRREVWGSGASHPVWIPALPVTRFWPWYVTLVSLTPFCISRVRIKIGWLWAKTQNRLHRVPGAMDLSATLISSSACHFLGLGACAEGKGNVKKSHVQPLAVSLWFIGNIIAPAIPFLDSIKSWLQGCSGKQLLTHLIIHLCLLIYWLNTCLRKKLGVSRLSLLTTNMVLIFLSLYLIFANSIHLKLSSIFLLS